jgi:predicted glycoside hydrolase/deacetylase ChbG (UPF0249 family)
MDATRYLLIIADDYGIGPETSRGILELAAQRVLTGTVLLSNSPHAADAVHRWRESGVPLEIGWHPNLTLDRPLARVGQVKSLVGPDGCFWPLGKFLKRVALQLVRAEEVERELRAQLVRFVELMGQPPTLVNSHQHCSLFPPVGRILRSVLRDCRPRPYFRRVRESCRMLAQIPGARIKRMVLSLLGHIEAKHQAGDGFPGQAGLAGITDPPWVRDPEFFVRWLTRIPGRDVELACHPGYFDPTLVGRDCHLGDGLLQRRVDEMALLSLPSFKQAVRQAGFTPVSPAEWLARGTGEVRRAA